MVKLEKHNKFAGTILVSKGQAFACGVFGNCGHVVLSPQEPPASTDLANIVALAPSASIVRQVGSNPVGGCPRAPNIAPARSFPSAQIVNFTANVCYSPEDNLLPERHVPCCFRGNRVLGEQSSRLNSMPINFTNGRISTNAAELLPSLVRDNQIPSVKEQAASALITLLLSGGSNSIDGKRDIKRCQDAFGTLVYLAVDDKILEMMATTEMLAVVYSYLTSSNLSMRLSATEVLQKMYMNEGYQNVLSDKPSLVGGVVKLLTEKEGPRSVIIAVKTLLAICLNWKNRCRVTAAGAVPALIDILPDAELYTAEKALAILELLGTTPEGRAEMSSHSPTVPVLVNMILMISDRCTEYAISTLCALCCTGSIQIQKRLVQADAPSQLLLLLRHQCTIRAKRKAIQLLLLLKDFENRTLAVRTLPGSFTR